jgi:hypothetical protein
MELRGSDGYGIAFERSGGYLLVNTWSRSARAGVVYFTKVGEQSANGIEAHLGKLGDVSVRFKPTGPVRRLSGYPDGCERTARKGVFLGAIDFHGELDYTQVTTDRANGTLTTSRGDCDTFDRPGTRGRLGAPLGNLVPTEVGLFANRSDRHQSAHFECSEGQGSDLDPFGPGPPDRRYFEVSASERYRGISIVRLAKASSDDPATFTFNSALTAASVAPPPPFAGTASLTRPNRKAWGSWTGSLNVDLPGAPDTPLAGPGFKANMDFYDYERALGMARMDSFHLP